MRLLLFALLAISVAFSASSCIANATQLVTTSDVSIVIWAVIALMAVVVALAYMIGTAINNANMIVFAKDEVYHLGFSLLLLVGFTGILLTSCSVMGYFFDQTLQNLPLTMNCYTPGASVNDVATCYIGSAAEDARGLSERYIQYYIDNMMFSTWSVSVQIPLFDSFTVTLGAYKKVISSEDNMIFNSFLIPALMSLSMQKLALAFISDNVVRWILPSAFLLRFAPPTRHMGNVLIALVVGLYIIVPFMYAFNLAMYDVVFSDCNHFASAACDNAIDSNACPTSPTATCTNPDSLWNIGRLIPQAFFLPNLTIALLVTFMSSMNKALRVLG